MTIYIFTILLLVLFSIMETFSTLSSSRRTWMICIAYLLLVLQVGLRWETGTDWNSYLDHYKFITDFDSTSPFLTGFENGYSIMVWLSKLIMPTYSFFLIFHAVIYYLLIFKSFQRYSPYLFISLLMFYTLTMGITGSNRQLIALAICIYALRYVIEKKTILFFLLIVLAISFHLSAIIFVIYYFLNRKIKPVPLIAILFFSFIIGKSQLPFILFSSIGDLIGGNAATKAYQYLEGAKDSLNEYNLSIIGLFKRLIFLALFYYNRKTLSEKLPYYNIMLNGYIFGIAFYFLFAYSLLVMVSRGSLFFNVMEPLLIASQVYLFTKKNNKTAAILVLLIFSFFFFFQSIITYPEIFIPYKSTFHNPDS